MSETEPKPPVDDPAEPAAKATRPAKQSKVGVGGVIRVGDGYALVVGYEKAVHQHEDSNGEKTNRQEREHPLIVDLPAPRRYELDHSAAS